MKNTKIYMLQREVLRFTKKYFGIINKNEKSYK